MDNLCSIFWNESGRNSSSADIPLVLPLSSQQTIPQNPEGQCASDNKDFAQGRLVILLVTMYGGNRC